MAAQQPDAEGDPRLGEHVVGDDEHRGLGAERRDGHGRGPEARVAEHPEGDQRVIGAAPEEPRGDGERGQLRDEQDAERGEVARR